MAYDPSRADSASAKALFRHVNQQLCLLKRTYPLVGVGQNLVNHLVGDDEEPNDDERDRNNSTPNRHHGRHAKLVELSHVRYHLKHKLVALSFCSLRQRAIPLRLPAIPRAS